MTAKELSVIAKKISRLLPDYRVKDSLVFKETPDAILLAVDLDPSSLDSRSFRVHAVFLPLFVPTEMIHYNYDKRLGSVGGKWNADEPNLMNDLSVSIRNEAIPFLNTVSTLEGVVNFIRPMLVPNDTSYINPHDQEALAYTLVKLNDVAGALVVLSQIQKMLNKSMVQWELTIRARAQMMEQKLLQNPEAALAQIETWKAETITNLKLIRVDPWPGSFLG